jgi:hypothetical protein
MIHEQPTNRQRALFWLASLLLAAACATAITRLLETNEERTARRPHAEAERLAALEEQLKRSNAALRRLEQVQLVQATTADEPAVKGDERAAASLEQLSADEAEPEPAVDAPAAPYPEEREKAFFSAYFSELDAAMSQQRADRKLAAQLVPLVPGVDRGLVKVLDLSCTEQLCRLEARYEHAERAERDRFIRDLQAAFAPVLTRASIHLPTDEKRLLGYFAKKGATMPRPTTSFAAFMRGDEG